MATPLFEKHSPCFMGNRTFSCHKISSGILAIRIWRPCSFNSPNAWLCGAPERSVGASGRSHLLLRACGLSFKSGLKLPKFSPNRGSIYDHAELMKELHIADHNLDGEYGNQ